MIVAIGLDVDEPFARFVEGAVAAEVPLRLVNLRAAVEGDWRFEVPARRPACWLRTDTRSSCSRTTLFFAD